VLTAIDFLGWLGQAEPGDTIEYHRGFLALDTMRHGSPLSESDRSELTRTAGIASWAFAQGFVHLMQRRLGEDAFSYLAIARRHNAKLSELIGTLP
jgi:hypothetical protein